MIFRIVAKTLYPPFDYVYNFYRESRTNLTQGKFFKRQILPYDRSVVALIWLPSLPRHVRFHFKPFKQAKEKSLPSLDSCFRLFLCFYNQIKLGLFVFLSVYKYTSDEYCRPKPFQDKQFNYFKRRTGFHNQPSTAVKVSFFIVASIPLCIHYT